ESGHNRTGCTAAVNAFLESYFRWIQEFTRQPILQTARHQVHGEKRIAPIQAAFRQSQRARPLEVLAKFTKPDNDGCPRFQHQPPLLRRVEGEEADRIMHALETYRENLAPERRHLFDLFHVLDAGFRVVGTGSVGMRDYVLLCEGNGRGDPMFLQLKQEVAS